MSTDLERTTTEVTETVPPVLDVREGDSIQEPLFHQTLEAHQKETTRDLRILQLMLEIKINAMASLSVGYPTRMREASKDILRAEINTIDEKIKELTHG